MTLIMLRHEMWKLWLLLGSVIVGQVARTPGMSEVGRTQAAIGMVVLFGAVVPGLAMFLRLLGRLVRWSKEPWRPAWRLRWWKLRSNWMAAAALAVAAFAGFLWSLPLLAVMFTWSYQEARAEERQHAELGFGGAKV
jgi:hypothetical protein